MLYQSKLVLLFWVWTLRHCTHNMSLKGPHLYSELLASNTESKIKSFRHVRNKLVQTRHLHQMEQTCRSEKYCWLMKCGPGQQENDLLIQVNKHFSEKTNNSQWQIVCTPQKQQRQSDEDDDDDKPFVRRSSVSMHSMLVVPGKRGGKGHLQFGNKICLQSSQAGEQHAYTYRFISNKTSSCDWAVLTWVCLEGLKV